MAVALLRRPGGIIGCRGPLPGAAFGQYAAQVLSAEPEPVAVLGIDETRRGRPVWVKDEHSGKWELVVDRWHIGFVDIGGGQGLLGQVEGPVPPPRSPGGCRPGARTGATQCGTS